MRIPRSYIEAYSKALNAVTDRARARLAGALAKIDYTADVADVREAVVAVMQQACGASTTLAARLAADFYDGLRSRFSIDDGFLAEVDSRREPEATEGSVRAFVQDLEDGKPSERFVGKCVDRIDYETRRAANECVEHNARRDPKRPGWARVPTGACTCDMCIMQASRGFAYHTEETASHAHANCDCRVVPSWDKKNPALEGYDPDLYVEMWRHPEDYPELREAQNARRRELYRKKKDENPRAGIKPINEHLYNSQTNAVIRNGGVVIRGGEDVERHLSSQGAEGIYIRGCGVILLHDPPTTSETLEECFHYWQDVRGDYSELDDAEMEVRREIDAKKYLLSVTDRYRIPDNEVQSTKERLAAREEELRNLLDGRNSNNS